LLFLSGLSPEQVLNAIGGPPGFTRGTEIDNGAYQDYNREYDGMGSTDAGVAWARNRLRALGLSNVQMFGDNTVDAACGQWKIQMDANFMPYGGPPSGPPGTSAVNVKVDTYGSGRLPVQATSAGHELACRDAGVLEPGLSEMPLILSPHHP
jgi:hypothetical protein